MEMLLGLYKNFDGDKVCWLKKAFYGVKQSSKAWLGDSLKQ